MLLATPSKKLDNVFFFFFTIRSDHSESLSISHSFHTFLFLFLFFFFFEKLSNFIKNQKAHPKYIGHIQEKHLTKQRKKIKLIMKTRNMETVIGSHPMEFFIHFINFIK
jgi:hypothetical protein